MVIYGGVIPGLHQGSPGIMPDIAPIKHFRKLKEARSISQFLDHILLKIKDNDPPADDADQQSLLNFWRENAGIAAPHTYPFWFSSGRMVVFCENAAWATQIRHQTPSLIKQLNAAGYHVLDLKPTVRSADAVSRQNPRMGKRAKSMSAIHADAMIKASKKLMHPGLKKALNGLAGKRTSSRSPEIF